MGLLNKFRKENKKKDVTEEVCEHLTALLNTKQMYGAWQKGLGMETYTSGKPRSDIIQEMIQDLKYNIETYEKRVKIVSIEVVNEKHLLTPRFLIECKLGGRFHSFYIGFKKGVEVS